MVKANYLHVFLLTWPKHLRDRKPKDLSYVFVSGDIITYKKKLNELEKKQI